MAVEHTLERVEKEIETGNLARARDRLHGLIRTYPNDLSLRLKLAEVYHRMNFKEMAGRYWYLEETKTPEMQTAVEVFKQLAGDNAFRILTLLKFRGETEELPEYAKRKLENLQQESIRKYGAYPKYRKGKRAKYLPEKRKSFMKWNIGCFFLLILALALLTIGIVTALRWIF